MLSFQICCYSILIKVTIISLLVEYICMVFYIYSNKKVKCIEKL